MNIDQTKQSIIEKWKESSLWEKISIFYILLLALFLIFFPVIHIGSLNSTELTSFWLYSSPMIRTDVIIGIALLSILGWNSSKKMQDSIEKIFGFRSNPLFINVLLLLIVLTGLFAIGDTLQLLQSQYSKIQGTNYLYIGQIAVVVGIIINIIGSCIKQQSRLPRSSSTQVNTIHDNKKAEAFKKVEQEFGGLFHDENMGN